MQRIIPYLFYRDAAAAIDFLKRAFGFEERMRYEMGGGRIGHAEVTFQGSELMLASEFEGFGQSPLSLPGTHGMIYCLVDDVEAHYARARAEGATLVGEPENQHGTRAYRAMDPEGHRWIFAQSIQDG
jgi:uncharacterized glyoxalase superfamily protein PhnB